MKYIIIILFSVHPYTVN